MGLPTKKITLFGDQEITITGLSCDQVEKMLDIGTADADGVIDRDSATRRSKFLVDVSTGKDFDAFKIDHIYSEFYDAFQEVHTQAMDLSGLKASSPGETLAVVEKSISPNSAAA